MTSTDLSAHSDGKEPELLVLRLYIAGAAPTSLRAAQNLERMCAARFPDRYTLEIVDVLKQPLLALNDGILVTPTLIKLAPPPGTRVIGDLSDEGKLLPALSSVAA